MKFLLSIYLVSLIISTASAQQGAIKDIKIEDVKVKGTRKLSQRGVSKTDIDSIALSQSASSSFAELLSRHSSLYFKSYGLGSLATVSFRGTAASHTQVEWNGININSPSLGQVDFSMIPVWFIDKAEILHGGSSLQESSGALGGTVNIGTNAKWDKKIYGSAMQSVGSYDNYQTLLTVGGGNKKVQTRVRYLYATAENDFKFFNNGVLPFRYQKQQNADYKKHGAVADIFFRIGGRDILSASGWFNNTNRNLPTIMSYEGKGRNEWQQEDEYRGVIRWVRYGKRYRSYLTTGYSATSLDYTLQNHTDKGIVTDNNSHSSVNSLQNRYKIEWDLSERTTIKGATNIDYHRVSTQNHIKNEGYKASRTEIGATLSGHHNFGNILSIFILTRYENSGSFMPSVGVEVEPWADLLINANITRNYHRPTLNDLYWLPGGNSSLRPEEGNTFDFSTNYSIDNKLWSAKLSATAFASKIEDWIIWQPSEYRYWSAKNIKEVFSRGIEGKFNVTFNNNKIKIDLSGNYGFTRSTNEGDLKEGDNSKGKQLIYIPIHKANLMLDCSYRGFVFNYGWSFTGERFTTSSNEYTLHSLPAYDLHNISISKRIKFVELEVKVENLLNKNYQAILWRAMPKRNFTIIGKIDF